MLVLSRKEDESLIIGSDIRVVVLSVGKGRVKLGIEAPARYRVMRSELRARPECAPQFPHDVALPESAEPALAMPVAPLPR